MAVIKVPVVIDGVKTIEELVQRVLDSAYRGRPLREWIDHFCEPTTKGDVLRTMTDEDLAQALRGCPDDMDACPRIRCQDCWLAWLRTEAAAEQCSALRGAKEGEDGEE